MYTLLSLLLCLLQVCLHSDAHPRSQHHETPAQQIRYFCTVYTIFSKVSLSAQIRGFVTCFCVCGVFACVLWGSPGPLHSVQHYTVFTTGNTTLSLLLATLHCLYYWQHYTVFTTGPLHSVQHLPCTLSNCVCVCVRACVGACACACACVHASFDGWPCSAVVYHDSVSYIPSW
jgi:hypothetical protein